VSNRSVARSLTPSASAGTELRVLVLAREIVRAEHPSTGAERRLDVFVRELEGRGIPVLVYAAGRSERPSRGTATTGAAWRHLPLPMRGLRRDMARVLGALSFVVRNTLPMRRFRPNLVLERAAYLDPSGALIARLHRIPRVVELHGDLAADARSYYSSPLAPLGVRYERRRYRRPQHVVVVSRGLADMLETTGVPASRISVVENGVTPVTMAPDGDAGRRRWAIGDRRVVGWIGHLMPWQVPAFERLVSGLSGVETRIPLALVLVAPQTEVVVEATRRLQRAAAFPVVSAGEALGASADDAVAGFDIGVIPDARPYDLPVKLFHYGMHGVAVVAPDTRSIRALDPAGDLMYFFAPGEVARVVEEALTDPERLQRAARFRRVVLEGHTWPAVVTKLLQVCQLARSAPTP
jgi:hypothetical protein